jgi:hypothetical protein
MVPDDFTDESAREYTAYLDAHPDKKAILGPELARIRPKDGFPKVSKQSAGAVIKDDCFGVAEPGSALARQAEQNVKDFFRRHAAGEIQRSDDSLTPPMLAKNEERDFSTYATYAFTPDEVAPARRERYVEYLARTAKKGTT